MLTDRYGLPLSTTSAVARDAYVEGVDLLLTVYPGATAAFDRALAADPDFALAHVGKARAAQVATNLDAMRASLATALSLVESVSAREQSHIGVFRHLFSGQPVEALAALRVHVKTWPRDVLILSLAANQGGLIGMCGLPGREQDLVDFLGGFENLRFALDLKLRHWSSSLWMNRRPHPRRGGPDHTPPEDSPGPDRERLGSTEKPLCQRRTEPASCGAGGCH